MSFRVGVISDTHGLLREEVMEKLQGCDRILHAGDIHTPSVAVELNKIAPTYFVRGNADKEWAESIPATRIIDDMGIRIFMVHHVKHIDRSSQSCDLIVYGHSHKYEEKHADGRVWLNPGSCGPRRFKLPVTMAMLYIGDDGNFKIERIDITVSENQADPRLSAVAVQEYLPAIMKEIDKGATVEQLMKRFHLPKELAEQICRLYLTHPGVDADGIMTKLGI